MKNEEKLYALPAHTAIQIERYVEGHATPGSFVKALFENDLLQAVLRADPVNLKALKEIVDYVAWETPGKCRGSVENVRNWLAQTQGEE